jgi:pimeloyl-ACP methyl ester carboxylesterase
MGAVDVGAGVAADYGEPGWHRLRVDGVSTGYAVAGEGRPVLFLHRWGLGHRTYSRPRTVRYLVLINSVGAGQTRRAAGRPGYIGGRPFGAGPSSSVGS